MAKAQLCQFAGFFYFFSATPDPASSCLSHARSSRWEGDDEVTSSSGSQWCCCPVCEMSPTNVAAMPVTWRPVGVHLNTSKVKFLPAAVNPDSWSAGHTLSGEESNDLHSQTNTVAHLHNNKAGAGGEQGTPWKSRAEYILDTKYEKVTSFPLNFFNDVSRKIKKREKMSCFFFLRILFVSRLTSHGSIVLALLIKNKTKRKKLRKTLCHTEHLALCLQPVKKKTSFLWIFMM